MPICLPIIFNQQINYFWSDRGMLNAGTLANSELNLILNNQLQQNRYQLIFAFSPKMISHANEYKFPHGNTKCTILHYTWKFQLQKARNFEIDAASKRNF